MAMLVELTVKNMAVIKSITLPFAEGLHVLTGETGAGKSILIDAIGLLLGSRSSADYVRHGAERAEVEGLFQMEPDHPVHTFLEQLGIHKEEDGTILIRREIFQQGKSICRVNGQVTTLSMLKEISPWLVQIHGQHEYQSLLDAHRHLHWLDTYGEKRIRPVLEKYRTLYQEYREFKDELERLSQNDREAAQRLDLLLFQRQEIAAANLQIGEDEELTRERKKIANAEKLTEGLSSAYSSLQDDEKGLDWVGHALSQLEPVAAYDEVLREPLELLSSALIQLEEAAHLLRDCRDRLEFDPQRLHFIESRLDEIVRLKRKYGKSTEEILQYAAQVAKEVDLLQNKDERREQVSKKLEQITSSLAVLAEELSNLRRQSALTLAEAIENEIRSLHMEKAKIMISVKHKEDVNGIEVGGRRVKPMPTGIDDVEFLMSPHPGEPLRPVAKIASGGELSRLMLAIKTILADAENTETLIFDEVDSGVSGRAAQTIAEKLSKVSNTSQVLCVTHLPQVASMADRHYFIDKTTDGQETETKINLLDEDGRIAELSRMLGGVELTEVTVQHAKEMIALARSTKKRG